MPPVPHWLLWANFWANVAAVGTLAAFVFSYGRTHFERSGLGRALMLSAAASLILASIALLYRLSTLTTWFRLDEVAITVAVGVGWLVIAVVWGLLLHYQRREQRDHRWTLRPS